jgi:hypothetical protein
MAWRLPLAALVLAVAMVHAADAAPLAQLLPGQAPALPKSQGERTTIELGLSLGVLAFGLLVMVLEVLVMFRTSRGWDTDSTRIVGLTLVVVAGLFLITAGYSQDQIAPMTGLLGTVAGYLLGRSAPASESRPG